MSGAAPARRITPPDWLQAPALVLLLEALGDARIVGGAVRNHLLGIPPDDLDLATPLAPEALARRLREAGISSIPTGLAHGTLTARLADGRSIEITSLRRDLSTDGRHAIVGFTDDWAVDAMRRDFTLNALYLDSAGGLWDFIGGIEDCLAGRIRFVGVPAQRIAEDRLRILRFYRMQARFGRTDADAEARAACALQAGEISKLAAERLRDETLKLLAAPDPAPTVKLMIEDGVLGAYLPPPFDPGRLAGLVALEPVGDPLRRLAALIGPAAGAPVAERLRLSRADGDRLIRLTGPNPIDLAASARIHRAAVYRHGAALTRDFALLAAAEQPVSAGLAACLALAQNWAPAVLPINGDDVLARGIAAGPAVGRLIRAVEAWWIAGDFLADRAQCLVELDRLLGADG